jgi:hypothetical protein
MKVTLERTGKDFSLIIYHGNERKVPYLNSIWQDGTLIIFFE